MTGAKIGLTEKLALETGFRVVYPLCARLPARLGLACARLWGRVTARLDCDWRSVALGTHFVSHMTRLGLTQIAPEQPAEHIERLTVKRFESACQEELEGFWLAGGLKTDLPVRIEGLDALRAAMQEGRGAVLLTFHFAAAIWGIGCLGRTGLPLSAMSNRAFENERVPASVRAFFRAKYDGLTRLMNGGSVLHHETALRECYRRLSRGQALVVLADAFAQNPERALAVDFFGQRRAFATGAMRLAQKTDAIVAAFVCLRENNGYRIEISPPYHAKKNPEKACRSAFAFLEAQVRAKPEEWWAVDLLPYFRIVPESMDPTP